MDKLNIKTIQVVTLKMEINKKLKVTNNKIYGIEQAQEVFEKLIGNSVVEKLAVLCLDSNYNPLNVSIVHIGKSNNVDIVACEVFKSAILSNASKIIICHNHPTGEILPSESDVEITKLLGYLGKKLGISLVDSLILGYDGECTSIRTIIRRDKNDGNE